MSKDKSTHPSEGLSISGGVAYSAPPMPVRTPWGRLEATQLDQETRDPFEPEAPLSPVEAAARAARKIEPASPPPLSPRELFEMLMTPAAQATRSSPLRKSAMAAAAGHAPAGTTSLAKTPTDSKAFPAQANVVLSALDAGQAGAAARDG